MKKLVLLFVAVFITAVSANVFAQSTGTAPYLGATHAYSVTLNAGSSYAWKVLNTSGAEVTAPTSDIASLTPNAAGDTLFITYATTATPTTEYLVTVTETVDTDCSNTKALPIQITESTFDLIVGNTGDQNCYASAVTVAWSGGQTAASVTYTHGAANYAFTVEGTGVGATETWTFSLGIVNDPTDATTTSVTVEDQSATPVEIVPVAGVYTLTGPQTVDVAVVVTNNTEYDNSSAADAQDFSATVTLGDVACGTGSIESDNTNNEGVEYVARPNTSGISTN
ncbi:hypothetical protein [uncultured Draconibacterium sp.]|uniref:hypothetical protein n=1 Tax=uncultured Draconibacterium sp. TaxID=1573823 RepID=UPI003216BC3C